MRPPRCAANIAIAAAHVPAPSPYMIRVEIMIVPIAMWNTTKARIGEEHPPVKWTVTMTAPRSSTIWRMAKLRSSW